jgi:hypothetical protein
MTALQGISRYMPREAMGGGSNSPVMPELSGKMFVLWRLMRQMRMPGNGADVSFTVISFLSFRLIFLTPFFALSFHMCRRKSS